MDVVVPDPGPGEAVVDVIACGVCHTDLTYREGGINDEYPFLLGHEAAGTVEAVGPGVTAVEPGDFVILNWRAVCGQCRACKRGRPRYCFDTFNAEQKMTLTDGTELTPALGIGAFADKTLVHAGSAPRSIPAADPAVAGLLGCGVMAGLGAAINTGAVTRDDTVAVIGCGGVGDAAIAGAALVGAKRIIAVDTDNAKLDWAREFGATHTVNARELDVVETIQDLTDGFGADVVIDAVGRPETWKQAFYARDLAGTVVLVGVPTPDMRLEMPLVDFFSRGGSLKSSWYGDCLPERDFPTLIDLYLQGRLAAGASSSPNASGSTTSRRRSTRCTPARCCARWWCCEWTASSSVVTHGTFELDGGSWEVDNNIWLVGDDAEVVVFDAAHDRGADRRGRRRSQCGGSGLHPRPQRPRHRRPRTRQGARRTGAAAPRRRGAVANDAPGQGLSRLSDGDTLTRRRAPSCGRCTPRATPLGRCAGTPPNWASVFSGDTLFSGGPGATGARTPTSRRS